MKTMTLKHCAYCAVVGGSLLVQSATSFAQAVTFNVNLQLAQSSLDTDPHSGNQIKFGDALGVTTAFGRSKKQRLNAQPDSSHLRIFSICVQRQLPIL